MTIAPPLKRDGPGVSPFARLIRFCQFRLNEYLAPVQDFVKYEVNTKHATDHGYSSLYSGLPSDEQDEAWDRLITRA